MADNSTMNGAPERDSKGRFVKGHGKNGAGRKKQPPEFREMLENNAPKALEAVIGIMNDPGASNRDRLTAANIVIERTYGKVPVSVDFDPNDDKRCMIDDIREEMARLKQEAAGELKSEDGGADPDKIGFLDDIRAEMGRLRGQR